MLSLQSLQCIDRIILLKRINGNHINFETNTHYKVIFDYSSNLFTEIVNVYTLDCNRNIIQRIFKKKNDISN